MKRIFIIAALCVIVCNAFAEELYTVCLPVPVSVYENAITDAKIIGSLAPKQEVEVYVVNGDWAIIKFNNGVGYVAAACLKKADNQPSEEPSAQQETQQPAPQQQEKTIAETKPTNTIITKKATYPNTDIYEPYEHYSLTSKSNRAADILRCQSNMYITFDYQLAQRHDPSATAYSNNGQTDINMHLGAFNLGGIARLWGPIGLDMGFGLGAGAGKYAQPAQPQYGNDGTYYVFDKTIRFRLDYNVYLRPVFGLSITDDIALHLVTGPRFDFIFLEEDFSYVDGDRKFAGDVKYASLEKTDPYRLVSIPWSLGLGFSYKHIGFRIMYEWELYGGYRNKYAEEHSIDRATQDTRTNTFTASLFIPIWLF